VPRKISNARFRDTIFKLCKGLNKYFLLLHNQPESWKITDFFWQWSPLSRLRLLLGCIHSVV